MTGRHGVPSLWTHVCRESRSFVQDSPRSRARIPLVCGRRMQGPTIHGDTTGDNGAVPSEVVPLPFALRQCWCAARRVSVVLAWRPRRLVAGPFDDSGSDLCRVPEGRDVAREKVHLIMAGGDISWAGRCRSPRGRTPKSAGSMIWMARWNRFTWHVCRESSCSQNHLVKTLKSQESRHSRSPWRW